MAYAAETNGTYFESRSPTRSPPRPSKRSSCQMDGKQVNEDDVVQGRIFWLPPKAELPEKAVRRAHGKGIIEEGIYNHPIVVISRPDDDRSIVHFHLVSFRWGSIHDCFLTQVRSPRSRGRNSARSTARTMSSTQVDARGTFPYTQLPIIQMQTRRRLGRDIQP
jgi:hypothetical protein